MKTIFYGLCKFAGEKSFSGIVEKTFNLPALKLFAVIMIKVNYNSHLTTNKIPEIRKQEKKGKGDVVKLRVSILSGPKTGFDRYCL